MVTRPLRAISPESGILIGAEVGSVVDLDRALGVVSFDEAMGVSSLSFSDGQQSWTDVLRPSVLSISCK